MKNQITLGIEAHNIRGGGGQVHFSEFINYLDKNNDEFKEIIIWTNNTAKIKTTSNKISFRVPFLLSLKSKLFHLIWLLKFSLFNQSAQCDIIFCPGGISLFRKKNKVIFLQNLLPFNIEMVNIYNGTKRYYKFILLRKILEYSIKNSVGVIFPSYFSMKKIVEESMFKPSQKAVCHHGVGSPFFMNVNKNLTEVARSKNEIKFLYVSTFSKYKRQLELIEVFQKLINAGNPISLSFAGEMNSDFQSQFISKTASCPNKITYLGNLEYHSIPSVYYTHDVLIFPSSIESFGIPLIEAQYSNMWIMFSDPNLKEIMEINNYQRYNLLHNNIANSITELLEKNFTGEIDLFNRKFNETIWSSFDSSKKIIDTLKLFTKY